MMERALAAAAFWYGLSLIELAFTSIVLKTVWGTVKTPVPPPAAFTCHGAGVGLEPT
jgi:hypothetical protein